MQEYKVKEMKRKLVFDKSKAFREGFEREEYLLKEYKENQNAVDHPIKEGNVVVC